MAVCPLLAAMSCTMSRNGHRPAWPLLKKAVDVKKIKNSKWLIAAITAPPIIFMCIYGLQHAARVPMPEFSIAWHTLPVLFFLFLIGAVGEEIGWMGYAYEPLEQRFGAWNTAALLGVAWAVWHIIPYMQIPQSGRWIFWQCLNTVFLRLIMVWFFVAGGRSVLMMVLFHAMTNVSVFSFPNFGSHYDPAYGTMIWGAIAVALYGYSRQGLSNVS